MNGGPPAHRPRRAGGRDTWRSESENPVAPRRPARGTAVLLLVAPWGGLLTPGPEPASTVMELVATLAAHRRFRPDEVRRETGIELSRVESGNPHWLFFESDHDARRAVARIEIRIPTSPGRAEESLLVLALGAVGCLSLEEVLEKYGRRASLDVPPPPRPSRAARVPRLSLPVGTAQLRGASGKTRVRHQGRPGDEAWSLSRVKGRRAIPDCRRAAG